MCSIPPATFSLLSFTHRKGDQPSMVLLSPTLSGAPSSSNTLALTPLFSDQTGKKIFPLLWLPFHCLPPCLMSDSTHLERKEWDKKEFLLSVTHLQLNGSYHTRSHFCKFVFKPKSHRNLVGTRESPWPWQ